jgi:hypothetical protein
MNDDRSSADGRPPGGADGQWYGDDEQLLAELAEALRAERAVPRDFVELGRSAYSWYDIDSELAALVYDSAQDEVDEVALTRSTSTAVQELAYDPEPDRADEPSVTRSTQATLRALTFVAATLTIEIEVTGGALLGQVVPPQRGEVEVRAGGSAPVRIPVDEVGCFTIQPIPSGPFRLHCRTEQDVAVLTSVVRL